MHTLEITTFCIIAEMVLNSERDAPRDLESTVLEKEPLRDPGNE
eukprot:CAMPEP_0197056666 /NCGR_PEP_ID=MMETSP1384-20130603/88525_1 /TAXON_ID=29189 /ORGANISM="Ammonia sp." /LENGTH=43 /DNA_ID= /DNA_START= /DNA_END= /DNA_ORIENTATION=